MMLQLVVFGFTLWFGCYLLAQNRQNIGLRFAGLGLVSYALGLASVVLLALDPALASTAERWRDLPILMPALCWVIAIRSLHGDDYRLESSTSIILSTVVLMLMLGVIIDSAELRVILKFVPIVLTAISLGRVWQSSKVVVPRRPLIAILTATVFFFLGSALIVVPQTWLSQDWVLLAISVDLIILGGSILYLDAYHEGTLVLNDALRSLLGAGIIGGVLGLQGGLNLITHATVSVEQALLVFSLVASGVVVEAVYLPLQSWLDKVIFADNRPIQQQRELMRSMSHALPQVNTDVNLRDMPMEEFARLTRRALSHYNDLNKLATSPLTQLPWINAYIHLHAKQDSLLERTQLLQTLLRDSILKLKPYVDDDFGTSEAWRYYNVLYYPYVVGLKPFSHSQVISLDDSAHLALAWFQQHVPERTLHNWQNTASKLVAQHLRDTAFDLTKNVA